MQSNCKHETLLMQATYVSKVCLRLRRIHSCKRADAFDIMHKYQWSQRACKTFKKQSQKKCIHEKRRDYIRIIAMHRLPGTFTLLQICENNARTHNGISEPQKCKERFPSTITM